MTLIMNLQNLQQENDTILMTKIMDNMAEEIIQPSNLKQKSFNQIFVITEMHIYSCGRRYKNSRCCCKY